MMKYILWTCLSTLLICSHVNAQWISGRVVDKNKNALPGANICLNSEEFRCTLSDSDGNFRIKAEKNDVITVCFFGFKTVTVVATDMITIVMEENPYSQNNTRKGNWGISMSYGIDVTFANFDRFEQIGKHNTDFLKGNIAISNLGIHYLRNKFRAGFSIGHNLNDHDRNDSIEIKVNQTVFALHSGYHLVNSERFLIIPHCALKWYRFRLLNGAENGKVSVAQYMSDKDLDMRFNQLTGYAGLNISYKFWLRNRSSHGHYAIGLYGGYLFKINSSPWIYSASNRITTDEKIDIKNCNFGLHITLNMWNI